MVTTAIFGALAAKAHPRTEDDRGRRVDARDGRVNVVDVKAGVATSPGRSPRSHSNSIFVRRAAGQRDPSTFIPLPHRGAN